MRVGQQQEAVDPGGAFVEDRSVGQVILAPDGSTDGKALPVHK